MLDYPVTDHAWIDKRGSLLFCGAAVDLKISEIVNLPNLSASACLLPVSVQEYSPLTLPGQFACP